MTFNLFRVAWESDKSHHIYTQFCTAMGETPPAYLDSSDPTLGEKR